MLNNSIKDVLFKKEPYEARIYGNEEFVIFRYYDVGHIYVFTKYDQCILTVPSSSNKFLVLANLSAKEIFDLMISHRCDINQRFVNRILMSSFEEFTKEEIATLPDWIFEELVMMRLQE